MSGTSWGTIAVLFITALSATLSWLKERHENKQKPEEQRAKSFSATRFLLTLAGLVVSGLLVYWSDVEKRRDAATAEAKAIKSQTDLKKQLDVLANAILNLGKNKPIIVREKAEKQPDSPLNSLSNETLKVLVNNTAIKLGDKYRQLMLDQVHFEDMTPFAKDDNERRRLLEQRAQVEKQFQIDNAQLFADADLLRRELLKRVGPLSAEERKNFEGPINSGILYGLLCRIVNCNSGGD